MHSAAGSAVPDVPESVVLCLVLPPAQGARSRKLGSPALTPPPPSLSSPSPRLARTRALSPGGHGDRCGAGGGWGEEGFGRERGILGGSLLPSSGLGESLPNSPGPRHRACSSFAPSSLTSSLPFVPRCRSLRRRGRAKARSFPSNIPFSLRCLRARRPGLLRRRVSRVVGDSVCREGG